MADFDIEDHTDEVLDGISQAKARALEKIGLVAEGYAKRLCPVDTGRLRNSITHTTDDEAAYIGTNVDYAVYVEMGTVNTPAQPYLKPAVEDHMEKYRSILKSELQDGG